MARVVVAPGALQDLNRLIKALKLPNSTRPRVRARLRQLSEHPESGAALQGRWDGFRFILGPWSWMLIVYSFDAQADQVAVVTIQDARSGRAPTSHR